MYFLRVLFVFVTVANIDFARPSKVSCRDEQNQPLDWYYLYKLPKHYSNDIKNDQSGLRYTYVTSDTVARRRWHLSNVLINSSASFPGRTFAELFDDPKILLIAYNDEVPDGPKDLYNGHTKGVVATDGINAIWLIHSVPRYPKISAYTYPSNGENYGQSFLCITLNAKTQMDKVVNQLLFNEPNVYFSRIPRKLAGRYPTLEKVIAKKWRSVGPFESLVNLKSLRGKVFKSFAKGRKFNAELYTDWIAPTLDSDLLVESWRNGGGDIPSNCSRKEKVYNVAMIAVDKLDVAFTSSNDHSKWAVASSSTEDWICVGDINRVRHQRFRGGGSVCQQNRRLARIYRGSVEKFDNCHGETCEHVSNVFLQNK